MSWRSSLSALIIGALAFSADTEAETVTLLHFSDYHSHAVPFYSEGKAHQGGLARAVGYMKRHKRRGALVFSGGDMLNKGAPAWSDKYGCVEWPWLNGVVDAMAFGNHDADYGWDAFVRCRDAVRYPILSANTEGFPRYTVLRTRGLRVGVFALAGSDFASLVRQPALKFADRVTAARDVVAHLRDVERVNAVVLIGHEHRADDESLARAVPGIDLIFGSHSHEKQGLLRIDGTGTWFIAPYQYLLFISRVEMTFRDGRMTSVAGSLIPVDSRMPVDKAVARNVARLQRELEADPAYRHLFAPIGTLAGALSVEQLAAMTVDVMREAARADVAVSTRSSFRQPLPPGTIDLETLRGALPYDNELVVVQLTRAAYQRLLDIARSHGASDAGLFISGDVVADRETIIVATTDYLARVAAEYRAVFDGAEIRGSTLRIRDLVRERINRGARAP